MRRGVRWTLAIITPLAVIAGVVYELATGSVSEPALYVLLIALPGVLIQGGTELLNLASPDRPSITVVRDGISALNSGHVTSVVLPIRIESRDPDRAVTLLDVEVVEKRDGRKIAPPSMVQAPLGTKGDTVWVYSGCDGIGRKSIFNEHDSQTLVEPNAVVDTVVMLREDGAHDSYELEIWLRDNFRRRYEVSCDVRVDTTGLDPSWVTSI